jgi:endogenous inhibitor of DNA gyrase (YacG/DUF329 family)
MTDHSQDASGTTGSTPKAAPCPICGSPALKQFRPFCSPRCADIDLNRWFTGAYAVPAVEQDEDEDEEGDGRTSGPDRG